MGLELGDAGLDLRKAETVLSWKLVAQSSWCPHGQPDCGIAEGDLQLITYDPRNCSKLFKLLINNRSSSNDKMTDVIYR